ncbi:MAG: ROK family protein [Candidatus Omnitrophica bacterium]|nr:ROK family protein [Candidatus Omnitrophota bacterium]
MKLGSSLFPARELTDRERKNFAILDIIRKQGPIARADVSKITGFNIVTVSNYVEHYIKTGLVSEEGFDISSGGRKPMMVDINHDAAFAVGVDFDMSRIDGLLTDLKGNIIHRVDEKCQIQTGTALVEKIKKVVKELFDSSGVDKTKIEGIGLSAAGVIGRYDRTLRWPGPMGTRDQIISASLLDQLEDNFKVPVIIENDANCAVFGEKWFTLSPEFKNIVYLFSGVACGIVINGQVYMGTTGCAGELGILNENALDKYDWRNESFGLGRWDMNLGMLNNIEEMRRRYGDSMIFKNVKNKTEKITFDVIVDTSEKGDGLASELLTKAGHDLGRKVAFLVNLFNPQAVIMGGGIEKSQLLMEKVKATVKEWAFEESTKNLKIIPAQLGDKAAPLGVASLVIKSYFEQV